METISDAVSQSKINNLHPKIRPYAQQLINEAYRQGIKLRITSGTRSYAEQAALYAKGRTAPGPIVTNAKPGYSFHNFGLALDVVPMVNGKPAWNYSDWAKIGSIGKSIGFSWGGDWTSFKDKPHFEMSFGNSLAMLRSKYDVNDFDATGFVNIA